MNGIRSFAIALGAVVSVLNAGCKKDAEEPSPAPVSTRATVRLKVDFKLDDHAYTMDSVVQDGAGHAVKFTFARFFISGAKAINDESQQVGNFPSAYVLVNAELASNNFLLGTMEPGHVHEVQFNLGLDSLTNHSDPTLYTEAPLNDMNMHWSWDPAVGYNFCILVGNVDDDGDGVVDSGDPGFAVNCAGDVLRTADGIHVHHTLAAGETFTVQGIVNMRNILAGCDVIATPNATGSDAMSMLVMHNLAAALDEAE